jgi:hypothetical protein
MFDGKGFLDVARNLSGTSSGSADLEAVYRTAVGRAYYACFHVLRTRLCNSAGWYRLEKGGKKVYLTHKKLRQLVARKMSSDSVDILDSLVEMREHADYHSWAPSVGAPGPAPSCLCSRWDPNPLVNCKTAIRDAEELLSQVPP